MRYDDVIIGAGSAGAVLAARLSEDPARQVLLIEAGPEFRTVEETPADLLNGRTMSLSENDWGFVADAVDGRKVRFPRGKGTGGSSGVTAMVALRGVPADYDEWAELGNPAWSFEQTLPYFRKLEHDHDFDTEVHGRGGPFPVRRWRRDELTATQQEFLDYSLSAGYPYVEDHNHPESTGVGPIPSSRWEGKQRVNTGMAYLQPARSRENLTVRSTTLVDRVLVRDGKAVGVVVQTGSGEEEVLADRVILSAGSIGSPAILLRSGIGPAADLRGLGIDPVADLPGVGANLRDHPRTGVFLVPKADAWDPDDMFLQTLIRTTSDTWGDFNDLQYYSLGWFDLTLFPELKMLSHTSTIFGVMVVHQKPRAQGSLRLTSRDPRQAPDITLNFLSDDNDVDLLVEGVRRSWELVHASKLRSMAERTVILEEGAIDSEDTMRLYVKLSLDSTYHPVGTARMGPDGDPGAVVDERCRVRSVPSLYVVDASVMPTITRANTNLTSIMIGERAADWLRAE